jgi:hypothetical protein
MPDDGFLNYLGVNVVEFDRADTDTDTYPERADAERESFIAHIADALRTLIGDDGLDPLRNTDFVAFHFVAFQGPHGKWQCRLRYDANGVVTVVTT